MYLFSLRDDYDDEYDDYYDSDSSKSKKIGHPKGKTPGNNKKQNKEFDYVVQQRRLTKKQARRLHDEITKKGYGIHELFEVAKELFDK